MIGSSYSDDYPVVDPLQGVRAGEADIVVTRLAPDGQEILSSTYLGGALGIELAGAVTAALDGRTVVCGSTTASDFPLRNPLQAGRVGFADAFVTVLAADAASIEFSTLFGGDPAQPGVGGVFPRYVGMDSLGRVFFAGDAGTSTLPARDPVFCGGPGFVAAIDLVARALVYATRVPLLGTMPFAVSASGDVLVAGTTWDPTFPATPGAFDEECGVAGHCQDDAFLLKLGPEPSPILTLALTPSETTVTEWDTTTNLLLMINTPQTSDTVATLKANFPYPWVEMPAAVTIPAGATSVTVPVRRRYHEEVLVQARLPWLTGGCEAAATIRYLHPFNFSMSPRRQRLAPGESTVLELRRDYTDGSEMTVQLAASRPDALNVAATAVMSGWSSGVDVPIEALAPAEDIVISAVATSKGKTTGALAIVSVALPVQPMTATIPVAAHLPGAAGTQWRTDVAALNPMPWPATVSLTLRADAIDATREVTIAPRAAVEWTDVVGSLFGIPPATSVAGRIEVSSNLPVALGTRTYNLTANGTYGQQFPVLPPASGLAAGSSGFLPLLRSNGGFRTNLGLVASQGPGSCSARVRLFAADGLQLGRTTTYDLAAVRWQQVDDVFAAIGAGRADAAYARVDVPPGVQCRVWGYASVIDNRTGDPTTVTLEPANQTDLTIPSLVHAPGALGSQWRSELSLINPTHLLARVEAEYSAQPGSAEPIRRMTVLFPGNSVAWNDVLVSLFGVRAAASSSGLVRVSSNTFLVAGCRTFNAGVDGSYGQSFPVFGPYDYPIREGQPGYLLPLRKSADFRTNVGLLNPGSAATARVRLYDRTGAPLGNEVAVDLPKGSWQQINDVFARAGAPPTETVYGVVEVSPTNSGVWAYASVVDNRTGDPTTVPAQVPVVVSP